MGFLYSQLFVSLPVPTTSFAGKTVIVTGSNIGLGKEAARHFTRLGAETVILAVRSLEKGEAAKRDIESTTGRTGVLRVMHLDMASHASVLSFAETVKKECPRIDVALLNAGVIPGTWQVFEGDEAMVTVNVVSTFLLALELLPKLEETAHKFSTRPTLTITASEVHAWARFEEREAAEGKLFERLAEEPKVYDGGERYHVSKLLEVFTVRALAERRSAKQIDVTINYVNPGLCHSGLGREGGWGLTIFKALVGRSTEAGSRNLVAATCLGPESHGQYVSDCAIAQPGPNVLSQEGYKDQERVWRELAARLEGIKKGVTKGFEP